MEEVTVEHALPSYISLLGFLCHRLEKLRKVAFKLGEAIITQVRHQIVYQGEFFKTDFRALN